MPLFFFRQLKRMSYALLTIYERVFAKVGGSLLPKGSGSGLLAVSPAVSNSSPGTA